MTLDVLYNCDMRRIQMYIDEDLDDMLRQVAAVEGRSTAAIIREAVRAYLNTDAPATDEDPFRTIIGAYVGGPTDAALEHDRYLYGQDLDREWRP